MSEKMQAGIMAPTLSEQSSKAMVEIYKMGILHAAFLLRGTDLLEVTDNQLDLIARILVREAENLGGIPPWKVPEDYQP